MKEQMHYFLFIGDEIHRKSMYQILSDLPRFIVADDNPNPAREFYTTNNRSWRELSKAELLVEVYKKKTPVMNCSGRELGTTSNGGWHEVKL